MTVTDSIYNCYQCGKKTIVYHRKEERIKGSLVISTKSRCSDPACQKRIDDMRQKEIERIREANLVRSESENIRNKYRKNHISLGSSSKTLTHSV